MGHEIWDMRDDKTTGEKITENHEEMKHEKYQRRKNRRGRVPSYVVQVKVLGRKERSRGGFLTCHEGERMRFTLADGIGPSVA